MIYIADIPDGEGTLSPVDPTAQTSYSTKAPLTLGMIEFINIKDREFTMY